MFHRPAREASRPDDREGVLPPLVARGALDDAGPALDGIDLGLPVWPVPFDLTWTREPPVSREELVDALRATCAALGFATRVVTHTRPSPDDDNLEEAPEPPSDAGVVLMQDDAADDEVEVLLREPVAVRATLTFTGDELALFNVLVDGDWELAYLFTLHTATLLAMTPEDRPSGTSSYAADARVVVASVVARTLERLGEGGTATVSLTATEGAVGPFTVEAERAVEGWALELRGAGTDLHVALGGGAGALAEADLLHIRTALRSELRETVEQERIHVLTRREPAKTPERAVGTTVVPWNDGVRGPATTLPFGVAISSSAPNLHGGVLELTHCISNGQPILRRLECAFDPTRKPELLWLLPSWAWQPADAMVVAQAFAEVAAKSGPHHSNGGDATSN